MSTPSIIPCASATVSTSPSFPRTLKRTGGLAALVTALLVGGAAQAEAACHHQATDCCATVPTVEVVGHGSAYTTPDLANVNVGVDVTKPTAKEASDAATAAALALLDAAHAQGITDQDIQTATVALYPNYSYSNGTSTLTGYEATQSFILKVRTIGKTGTVVTAVTNATGNAGRVSGVSFDIADHKPLNANARDLAFADALSQAQQYANLSGRPLGPVIALSEGNGGQIYTPMRQGVASFASAAAPSASVPVLPGQIREDVTVTAVYGLVPPPAA